MLSDAEWKLYYWRHGTAGSFTTQLFELGCIADSMNFERLRKGFPNEMAVLHRYKNEDGYWEDLCNRVDNPTKEETQ